MSVKERRLILKTEKKIFKKKEKKKEKEKRKTKKYKRTKHILGQFPFCNAQTSTTVTFNMRAFPSKFSYLNISLRNFFFFLPFWNCFKNLLHSLFVVWCFLSSTVHSFKRATFFLLFIGILTQQRNMHPEIMPPACYENHISFFLYTEKKGEAERRGCNGM